MTWKLPASDTYFGPALAQTPEGFELDHLEYALQFCKKFRLAIDGGAHVGTWTVALAKRFNRVIAFEPAPDTYDCLVENTAGYSNVETVWAALGAENTFCNVNEDPTRFGNTGARTVEVAPLGGEVQMVTLDSQLMVSDLDFLKLDLEGFESEAIRGAEQLLSFQRPVVLMECKSFSPPRFGGPERAVRLLVDLGYTEVGGVRNDKVFLPS